MQIITQLKNDFSKPEMTFIRLLKAIIEGECRI